MTAQQHWSRVKLDFRRAHSDQELVARRSHQGELREILLVQVSASLTLATLLERGKLLAVIGETCQEALEFGVLRRPLASLPVVEKNVDCFFDIISVLSKSGHEGCRRGARKQRHKRCEI